tara:strand:- start:600 stop:1613 length:1014 start_codon:yes stop_codon:yes gene_type:complete
MKKLSYLVSAVAAVFAANAHADVSVSGSADIGYLSDVTGDGRISMGSGVVFGLSTTTANGIGMSTGLSVTVDQDADNGAAAGGGQSMTFTTGGATIVVGDVELGDTPGSIGGTVGNLVGDVGQFNSNVATGFADDDGTGVTLSTAAGAATVSVGYIVDDNANNSANMTDATDTMSAFSISMPMGNISVTAGVADHDNGETASGATVSVALGGGTLAVGYSQQTLNAGSAVANGAYSLSATSGVVGTAAVTDQDLAVNGDSEVMGATYSMSLDADTSIALGYQNAKDADSHSTTRFDISLSRSLGGGASVYLDMRTLNGDVDTNGGGTAMGFGTAVSF